MYDQMNADLKEFQKKAKTANEDINEDINEDGEELRKIINEKQ